MIVEDRAADAAAAPAGTDATATGALLLFAQTADADGPLASFDSADVSAAGTTKALGAARDAAWWDSSRDGLRLRGRSLGNASLKQANLSGADLGEADLSGVKGSGLQLRNSCVEGTDFSDADLIGADFSGSSAGEANFSGALLEDANLHRARLRFADLTDAIMDGANVSHADLWGARLSKTAAERADFRSTRLDESKMDGADVSESDFTASTLRRADLTGARLRRATFRDAVLDGTNLSGADLSGAVLANVSLATCNLTHTRFAGAWLERTRMRARQLGGAVGEEVAGELEAALDSYLVLEQNFASLGSSEDASWAYRRKRRVGRALHWKRGRESLRGKSWTAAFLHLSKWVADVAAEWLCDYGESLGRVVRAFFTILIVFALIYWFTGSVRPREGFAVTHSASRVVNYLLFSLDSMTTVGTSEVALRSNGTLGVLLSSLQTVIGTVLLGLFGFVLGARIRN